MSTNLPRTKVRDIPPTTLRLPPELRDELMRQATMNGRSLTQEITMRLQVTLEERATAKAPKHKGGAIAIDDTHGRYATPEPTDSQRLLLTLFNAMAPDKQLALLTLLRR